ncbi:MAG TPA: cellulase family glycosylhydrolase [Anaerolineales bacterium]|nr:cellulase family glycosylhydrolase [Anaerolineales bacterium]
MLSSIWPRFLSRRSTPLVGFSHMLVVIALLGVNINIKQTQAASNYLHTSGNRILDASGREVGLSGINWFGFETENRVVHGLWQRSWQDMLDQIQKLGYNVIRLPFSNAMLAPGTKPTGIDYQKNPDLVNLTSLEVMDRIIAGASARGLRVILDNHRSTSGGGPESNGLWYTSTYPESRWIDDWKMLARRYKGNDTVIGMDLRNEPFGACWGCSDPSKDWRLAAEKAGNAILAIHPDLLIIVEGVANHNGQSTWWGGNLMGAKDFPIRLDVPNRLVYSPHEYPASIYPQAWFTDASYPDNLLAVWDRYWGYLAADYPILIGEFGTRFETERDRQWLEEFKSYIQAKRLHWTFWSLNPNSGDTGGILRDDWLSVHQEKQNILKTIQYPFIGSGSSPSITSTSPATQPSPAVISTLPGAGETLLSLDNFESAGIQKWRLFHSSNSSISANMVSPGLSGTYAVKIDYGVGEGGWAGIERTFAVAQNWTAFETLSFGFLGTNSGATIRFEVLDNRAPGSNSDTAERFEYKFTDNFTGWKTFDLPWSSFVRRSDWQPEGAPNDGLGLTAVWGFNVSPVNGQGSFQLDEIALVNR